MDVSEGRSLRRRLFLSFSLSGGKKWFNADARSTEPGRQLATMLLEGCSMSCYVRYIQFGNAMLRR